MKTRKKFTDNVRQVYAQHKNAVRVTSIVIWIVVMFIAGYLVSWNFLEKPLNDGQFEFCEEVAMDVYAQKGQIIVETPEEVDVNISSTTITVGSPYYRGKVVAKFTEATEKVASKKTVP